MSDAAAKRRARQTVINLALSLLATLGVVLTLVLMVPRDDSSRIPRIDYKAVAQEAQTSAGVAINLPNLPKDWWSNNATWRPEAKDAVPNFEAGFVGPKNQYIGFIQGFGANPTWLALKLQDVQLTGSIPGASGPWDIYTAKVKNDPAESWDYVMVNTSDQVDYIILYGTATPEEFADFAASIDESK
ncbi:MAG: hypothetical protein RLZZ108_34 [Actinomycetota bacterium]